jgi:hypothetical protein
MELILVSWPEARGSQRGAPTRAHCRAPTTNVQGCVTLARSLTFSVDFFFFFFFFVFFCRSAMMLRHTQTPLTLSKPKPKQRASSSELGSFVCCFFGCFAKCNVRGCLSSSRLVTQTAFERDSSTSLHVRTRSLDFISDCCQQVNVCTANLRLQESLTRCWPAQESIRATRCITA